MYGAATFVPVLLLSEIPDATEDSARGLSAVFILGFLMLALPRVGWRKRDAFLAFIPFYGLYTILMTCWRLAYLPNRDWTLREEALAVLTEATPTLPSTTSTLDVVVSAEDFRAGTAASLNFAKSLTQQRTRTLAAVLLALAVVYVGDQYLRHNELKVFLDRAQQSEAVLGQVNESAGEAVAAWSRGGRNPSADDAFIARVVVFASTGFTSLTPLREEVAAVRVAPWHFQIRALQDAYLAHQDAWLTHLQETAGSSTLSALRALYVAKSPASLAVSVTWDKVRTASRDKVLPLFFKGKLGTQLLEVVPEDGAV